MVREWVQFTRRPDVQGHVAFISDYDMLVAEQLVQGVDVWINTPRRPWEASGTSGMKVLVNGGLNLSELDGWWAEAYSPAVGWALGDGKEHGDDPAWDAQEAEALYTLLEREVVPAFYARDPDGIPTAWVARMRESMARLTPQFSTNRVVREYTERYYLPAAEAYRHRAADHGATGAALVQWQTALSAHWGTAHFGDVHVDTVDGQHRFQVHVYLGDLDPAAVSCRAVCGGSATAPRRSATPCSARDPSPVRQTPMCIRRSYADARPANRLHTPPDPPPPRRHCPIGGGNRSCGSGEAAATGVLRQYQSDASKLPLGTNWVLRWIDVSEKEHESNPVQTETELLL